jgi:hypothetical protein
MYLFMAGTGIPAPVVSQNVTRAMTTSSRFYGNEAKRQWYDRCCGRGNGGQSEASYWQPPEGENKIRADDGHTV